ncbi:beta-glucosidase family protein [Actinomadura parmotrematis]|uniref:Glycoside hydrolase family 3 C-terminal domain-containing protein n=1 Tax=Actinomadura parmotrematis TaxID=2864039 RepID=A0ABS7FKL7_9ACTN|nr:glycoside hydrolase family 3 C-terminal domain-containing protein [Actinomadura parmotrematis]MBW8480901.1 glycoside hydrolase family 3 C-terminal domain-containing protein [Actinomadura parmotrematis]
MRARRRRAAAGAAALAAVLAPAVPASAPAAGAAASRCGDVAARPWCRASLSPDARAALLLPRMTVDERIGLLASDDPLGGPLGGFIETAHADTGNGVPRLGIPPLYMADGPAGIRQGKGTALPAPIALAAGFDDASARLYGATAAWEARHRGNDLIFGPSVDVLRAPRNGRSFEAFGEDPYLSAALGASWVRGAQGQGVMASVKHLAVYTQEGSRQSLDSRVDERTLREVYLVPFEAAVKTGGAATVMCGFGKLNGRWACQDGGVLNTVLREEWGFKGLVASDHTAVQDGAGAANGGLDLELPIGLKYNALMLGNAVRAGQVAQATLDARTRTVLRTMFAAGLFDRPAYANDLTSIGRTASEDAARRVEEGGITLLKNAGVLPLGAPKSIALVGAAAEGNPSGFGSSQVQPFSSVTPRAAITARAGAGAAVTYNDGRDVRAAADAARRADVAIVFATDSEGEFFDRSCLTLNCGDPLRGDQDGLIAAVAAANPRTVVVLETGGPVLTPWAGRAAAVVEGWYPGQQGGTALARVLYGDADPGGRLPVTFPAAEADAPAVPAAGRTATFAEGVFVGYRHYDRAKVAPAFPFGHGLSYTTFGYRGLSVSASRVRVTVTNTGTRTGAAVPQLYLGLPAPDAATPQPPRQLRGYTKVVLAPGQSAVVTFPLTARSLSYWDVRADAWKVAKGCYRAEVGDSSRAIALSGRFAQGGATCH